MLGRFLVGGCVDIGLDVHVSMVFLCGGGGGLLF